VTKWTSAVHRRVRRAGGFALLLSAAGTAGTMGAMAGCRSARAPTPTPQEIVETIFLIGDAGEPDPRLPATVLDSLAVQAAAAGSRGTIVFLGDNVYPAGTVEPDAPNHADALRRLDAQIRVVPNGGTGIFVPGNHDWADGGQGGFFGAETAADGLFVIRRQTALIPRRPKNPGATVMVLPPNGCPGPVVVDKQRVRLILLDTQWWLHNYIVRDSLSDDRATGCTTHTVAEVTQAIRDSLRTTRPGQSVIVAGHHPLRTGGVHGGYCGAFALFRRWANTSQDLFGKNYTMMRDSVNSALATRPPLIFAAGHDHSLQVMRGRTSSYALVSGAGSIGKGECAARLRQSLYVGQATSGFMRLDFAQGDSVLLRVYRYDGNVHGEVYSHWLRPRR
jgi:hypothetical protein